MKGTWKEGVLGLFVLVAALYALARAFDYLDSVMRNVERSLIEVVLAFGGLGIALFLGYASLSGLMRLFDDAKEYRNNREFKRLKARNPPSV